MTWDMDVTLLIDAIVRQTTVLIAQLATQAGTRATLAHTANQLFAELVRELKDQGLGNKVIADMFGLGLRTYHNRVARLAESSTERGSSLWEALSKFVEAHQTVTRAQIRAHFARDDEALVGGVLKDLVDSGLVFRSGRGDESIFKSASVEDLSARAPQNQTEALAHLVWVVVSRFGPMTEGDVRAHVPAGDVARALDTLLREGRVRRIDSGAVPQFASDRCVIPLDEPLGWEAAVFDHYQAMVTAITIKLRSGQRRAAAGESVGGSTYTFDLWKGHPHAEEVLAFLQETRDRAVALRNKVEAHASTNPQGAGAFRVIAYAGQAVIHHDEEDES
jgi:hypothetical protein